MFLHKWQQHLWECGYNRINVKFLRSTWGCGRFYRPSLLSVTAVYFHSSAMALSLCHVASRLSAPIRVQAWSRQAPENRSHSTTAAYRSADKGRTLCTQRSSHTGGFIFHLDANYTTKMDGVIDWELDIEGLDTHLKTKHLDYMTGKAR